MPCQENLLKAYGLKGLQTSKELTLDMCPSIKHSCCRPSDQVIMYNNWQVYGERQALEQRLKADREVYFKIVDEAVKVQDIAQSFYDAYKQGELTTCTVLANRVAVFNIKAISEQLKEKLLNMHEYFLEAYTGFYCIICDADLQQFIKPDDKQVVYTTRFCRSLLQNTLHFLAYLHSHLAKYLNLELTFIARCKSSNEYLSTAVPSSLLFTVDEKVAGDLFDCISNRNSFEWMDHCQNVCANFNLVQYSTYYQPFLTQYKQVAEALENYRKVYLGKAQGVAPGAPNNHRRKRRL